MKKNNGKILISIILLLIIISILAFIYKYWNKNNSSYPNWSIEKSQNVEFDKKNELQNKYFSEIKSYMWDDFEEIIQKQDNINKLVYQIGQKYGMKEEIYDFMEIIKEDEFIEEVKQYYKEKEDSNSWNKILINLYLKYQAEYPQFTYFADIEKFKEIVLDDNLSLIIDNRESIENSTLPNGMIVDPEMKKIVMNDLEYLKNDFPWMSIENLAEYTFYKALERREDIKNNNCYSIENLTKQVECLYN